MKVIAVLFVVGVAFIAGHIYGDKARDEVATVLQMNQSVGN